MALALDEPHDDDEKYDVEGLTFLVAPNVAQMLQSFGQVNIDYLSYPWGGQISVKAASAGSCC